MPLHTESRRRERILLYGPWGGGKSYAWVRLAKWLHQTKSPAKIRLLDADRAFEAQCDAFPGFEEVVIPYAANTWQDFLDSMKVVSMVGQIDDWLVIDRIDTAWRLVQNEFTEKVYGKNLATYFVDAKAANPDKHSSPMAAAHGEKWGIINKMYDSFMMDQVLAWKGHSIWVAEAKDFGENDSEQLKKIYERHGLRPAGQGLLGLQCLTAIKMQPKGSEWIYTTPKDLHRELQTGQPMNDFVLDYLVKVAKWKLA